MDFTLDEAQTTIAELAGRIVGDHCDPGRLRDLDRAGDGGHDPELWSAIADAGLVGIGLPDTVGGGGLGLVEAALVAEAVGRGPGAVPMAEGVAVGRALGRGRTDRALALAGDLARGRALVVPALREGPTAAEVRTPETAATQDGERWWLRGEKRFVFHSAPPAAYLISARTERGTALFVSEATDVAVTEESTTTTGGSVASLVFDGSPATPVSEPDDDAHGMLLHELRVLRCAHYAGVGAGALDLTAEHAKRREQFGSAIGTFQAVAHRLADAWLDVNLMQSTYRQAAWRSDNDYPADQAAASAALWACQGGQRVVHAAQHVHGGVGMDLDYPVHRFFRWAKEIDLALGGAGVAIEDLGAAIATEPLTIG